MHIQIVHMWLPRKSILSRCTSLHKVVHNKTLVLGIWQLCIGPDIKLNWKSGHVCIHIWPLSRCISKFFYITGQHCYKLPVLSSYLFSYLCTYIGDLFHTESVTKVKPNINSVKVHPQLSNIRHPVEGHWWALVHCGQKSGALWSFFSLLGTKKLSQTPIDPTYHSYTYNQYSCSVNHWTNWAQFHIIAVFLTYSSSDQRCATYQMLLFAPYSSATLVSGSKNF
jgi:hypothetical protein